MKNFLRASVLLCCVSMLPMIAQAAQTPRVVAESARTVEGGRAVEITVGQAELKSNINSIPIVVTQGGLAGALIGSMVQSGIESSRAKKAEAAITPVRDALIDFNADDLAVATTKTALAKIDWMQPTTFKFSKDASQADILAFLDSTDATQAAYFTYTYDLAPDFASVRVLVHVTFANKAQPENVSEPDARLKPKYLAYTGQITSVVMLPGAGTDINANAQKWAADKGKLARQGLTLAFSNAETLISRTLVLSDDDVKAMNGKDKPRQMLAGFPGRVQETAEGHNLLWSDGFVQVDSLPADAPAQTAVTDAPAPAAPPADASAPAPAAAQ